MIPQPSAGGGFTSQVATLLQYGVAPQATGHRLRRGRRLLAPGGEGHEPRDGHARTEDTRWQADQTLQEARAKAQLMKVLTPEAG